MLKDTDWLLLPENNFGPLKNSPDYLKNITLLDLSSSNIIDIDKNVLEAIIKDVKHLDIRGNKLRSLPQTITKANITNKLWISNNPYECNCDMIWMKDWLMDTKNVMDKDNVTCSTGKIILYLCLRFFVFKQDLKT